MREARAPGRAPVRQSCTLPWGPKPAGKRNGAAGVRTLGLVTEQRDGRRIVCCLYADQAWDALLRGEFELVGSTLGLMRVVTETWSPISSARYCMR